MHPAPARIAKIVVIGLGCLYPADWGVFQAQMLRGAGIGSVAVQHFMKVPFKGNRAEYDYEGTENENCTHSLFPQYAASAWNSPCWWLERHKVRWENVDLDLPAGDRFESNSRPMMELKERYSGSEGSRALPPRWRLKLRQRRSSPFSSSTAHSLWAPAAPSALPRYRV